MATVRDVITVCHVKIILFKEERGARAAHETFSRQYGAYNVSKS
jgi:hypothetical protein